MKFVTIAATAALLASAAQAAEVLDQSSWVSTPTSNALSGSGNFGGPTGTVQLQVQSLTAGLKGKLTRIDLQLWRGAGISDLDIGLARGIVGTPSLRILGLIPVARSAVPTGPQVAAGSYLSLDVSGLDIFVHPGNTLSIGVLARGQDYCCNVYRWANGELDADGNLINGLSYAGGFNQLSSDGGDTWVTTGLDRGFRTYVDTSFVPEPADWALLIAGFGLTGTALRRRRAAIA